MFKLVHKNRKGFTMVELLVTLVVLGIVIGMAGNLLYQLTNFNNMANYRYEIQTAVRTAYNKFESKSNSIIQSYQADVLYDPNIASGITFTVEDISGVALKAGEHFNWNSGSEPLAFSADSGDSLYTYIFSTPATSKDGNNLGMLLFIRNYNTETYELYLDPEGLGTLPVEIRFSIGTNVPPVRSENDYDKKETPTSYVSHSIGVIIKSGRDDVTEYAVDSAYTLENIMQNNKTINFVGSKLVYESAWGEDGKVGPAGWVYGSKYDVTDEDNNVTTVTVSNFPETSALNFADNGNQDIVKAETDRLTEYGNIMRFISPEAYQSGNATDSQTDNIEMASCFTGWAMRGDEMAERVLDNLRDFRDEVLRGTEIGDWIIHEYYYTWSPFLIENTAFLKPVYQAVLVPVSYVCEFIANL